MFIFSALLVFTLVSGSGANDSDIFHREKPLGSVLRTVRDSVHLKNDSSFQTLEIETTRSKKINSIIVQFGIYQDGKLEFRDRWKALGYFDPKDHLSDTIKWRHLEYLLKVFFVNQNFTTSGDDSLYQIFERADVADITPGGSEAKEFEATPHTVYSVYGGRDHLYALTWLDSKKKFVKVWKN